VVLEQYVEKGTVRFVSRHFAFLGPESTRAAEAAECAADQDDFEEYSGLLLANQQSNRNAGGFSDVRLVAFARFAGMDEPSFESCLLNDTYAADVAQDVADAEALGVRGTPSVFVNGEFISPASVENVTGALDRALAVAGAN
jgi:protein-disulfide isomerase